MKHPISRLALSTIALVVLVFLVPAITGSGAPPGGPQYDEYVFLPFVAKPAPTPVCPTSSSNSYGQTYAYQVERDNPVRPAFDHADKNLALRGYSLIIGSVIRSLVDYGTYEGSQPPQLATLFRPYRVPFLDNFYQVHDWLWPTTSTERGTRGAPLLDPRVTALGMRTAPGEALYVPASGYRLDEDGQMEVVVLFADEDTVTLKYTRADGYAYPGDFGDDGYTLHVDRICTDPNLLAKYNALDNYPYGDRYQYVDLAHRPYTYDLPVLSDHDSFGTARADEIVVAIVDSGTFMDPRSCNEWWEIRPGYTGGCPQHD